VSAPALRHPSNVGGPDGTQKYEGQWFAAKGFDYVINPYGLLLDPLNSNVLLTLGHQDQTGHIAQLDLERLIASLDPVNRCPQ